jgi:hypothetical protein
MSLECPLQFPSHAVWRVEKIHTDEEENDSCMLKLCIEFLLPIHSCPHIASMTGRNQALLL